MDVTERIALVFRPADLGLVDQPALSALVEALLTQIAPSRPGATPEQLYQHVRAELLYLQLRALLREPDKRKLGDVEDRYDYAQLVSQVRRDLKDARVLAGLPALRAYGQPSMIIPVVATFGGP